MNKNMTVAIGAVLMSAGLAQAAIITWSGATGILTSNDVATTGALVEAYNFGPTGVADQMVNGVTFAGTSAFLDGSSGNSQFNQDTGDVSYNAMLNQVDYGSDISGNKSPATLTLGGGNLVDGNQYLLQVWYVDTSRVLGDRVMTFADGESANSVSLDAVGTGGAGEYAVGTFTADASTLDVVLTQTMGAPHVNAYQIRAIPEPATFGLIAMAAGGLLVVRRFSVM